MRRRDGAAGVLDDVVGGPRGVPQWRIQRGVQGVRTPPRLFKSRYCLYRFFGTSDSLVTILNAYNNALVLKAYFEVSSRSPRLPMTRFLSVDTQFAVIS